MFPFVPSLLLVLLLAAPALLTPLTSQELEVRGQRTPRDAKEDSIKVSRWVRVQNRHLEMTDR